MLTRVEALAIVSKIIADMNSRGRPDRPVVVCEEHTVERESVFAFFYNSKKYVETGNPRDAVYGNGPIIVNRRTGAVKVCGTHPPPRETIDDYERKAAAGDW